MAAVLRPWTIDGRARKTGQIHDTDPNLGPLSIAIPGDVTVVFDGNAGLVTGRTGDGVLGHEGLVPARIVVFHLGNSLLDSAGNGYGSAVIVGGIDGQVPGNIVDIFSDGDVDKLSFG